MRERIDVWERLAAHAEAELQRNRTPGLVLAIAKEGQIAYQFAHGYRNVEESLPATPASRFGIGSITKSFTALALMQLLDAGKLSVDHPVTRYLPLRFPGAEQITLHHLLTHSAGLPMLGTEGYAMNDHTGRPPLEPLGPRGITQINSAAELIELLNELDFTPIAPPGAVMSYSNDGYALLGAVIEAVSGRPWTDYITAHITEPLGMADTVVGAFDRVGGGTRRYDLTKDGEFQPGPGDLEVLPMASAGGGPQLSTVQDLVRYLEVYRNLGAVDGVRIASEAAIRRMMTPYFPMQPNLSYGYALTVRRLPTGESLVSHNGGDLGVAASIGLLPERGITLAVQSNLGGPAAGNLFDAAVRIAVGAEPAADWTPSPIPATAADLERWVGTYVSERVGAKHRIFMEAGALKIEFHGQVLTAEPVAADALRFAMKPGDYWVLSRAVDSAGASYGIRVGARVFTPA